MTNHKSLWTVLALASMLITGVTLTVGVAAPAPASTPEKSLTPEEAVEVRMDEEERLASLDNSYQKQMRALAKQYRATAALVASQGGDPTGLLEAAAHFEKKANGD